jgi:uncharacterized protein (DUF362 family)
MDKLDGKRVRKDIVRSNIVAVGHSKKITGTPTDLNNKSLVEVHELITKTIDRSCNFKSLVHNKVVLIKPNLVRPGLNGLQITTDLRVIHSVAQKTIEDGAKRVIIGEKPGYKMPARKVFEEMGINQIAKKLGVETSYFDEEPTKEIEIAEAKVFKKIIIPKKVLDCDILINVPKVKTHIQTIASLGIKNLLGLILDDQRQMHHHNDLNYKLVDILRIIKPAVTVADALWPVQGQGPLNGENIKQFNTIIAGTDVVAVDAVTCSIMGIDPFEIDNIRIADMEGLGCGNLMKIKVKGTKPTKIRKYFKRACMSSMGAFPNVLSMEGGACQGCLSSVRHSLDKLQVENLLQKKEAIAIYSGMQSIKEDKNIAPNSEIWLFGDCACLGAKQKNGDLLKKVHIVPGCPPHVFDLYKAMNKTEVPTSMEH